MFSPKEIGSRIAAARNALGWRQEDLARATGQKLKASRIGNYEQGIRTPGPDEFAMLGAALGVSPMWLIGFSPLKHQLQNEEYELITRYRAMSARQKEELLDRARRMAEAETPAQAPGKVVAISKNSR